MTGASNAISTSPSMNSGPSISPKQSRPPVVNPRKRRRSEVDSEEISLHVAATEHTQQQIHLDLGKGLIASVLGSEHDDASNVWEALRTNQIDDPFDNSKMMSPVTPGTFSYARTLKSSFPSLEEVLRLADIAFHTCYRLHETVKRDDFRRDIAILYDTSQERDDFPYLDQCTLLAAVIALAHALDADSHNATGCSKSLNQGFVQIHFHLDHISNNL